MSLSIKSRKSSARKKREARRQARRTGKQLLATNSTTAKDVDK